MEKDKDSKGSSWRSRSGGGRVEGVEGEGGGVGRGEARGQSWRGRMKGGRIGGVEAEGVESEGGHDGE